MIEYSDIVRQLAERERVWWWDRVWTVTSDAQSYLQLEWRIRQTPVRDPRSTGAATE